ncbi:MAG TPA: 5-formyltetrahydrofolate cyclo-ligase [Mycobacteriales bacterium]|nr:5-formyltetrahydrofolate cyclo-ligase [Mycobacteriales bacterium]
MCDDKAALRDRVRRGRRALTPADLETSARALRRHVLAAPALRRAGRVAAYVPVGSEPGSVALLDELRDRGVLVLLPVVRAGGELDWAGYTGALRPGPLGLREPVGTRLGPDSVSTADLVLAPALAADRRGHRLGRGAGFYDRALARLDRSVPVAALLHDGELLDTLPAEPHDRSVTAAVTPALGWVELC